MASVHYQALEDRQRGSSGQVERWKIYKKEESSKEPSKTEENKKKKVEDIITFYGRAEEEEWSPMQGSHQQRG